MQISQDQYNMAVQSVSDWLLTPLGLITMGLVIAIIVGLSIAAIING